MAPHLPRLWVEHAAHVENHECVDGALQHVYAVGEVTTHQRQRTQRKEPRERISALG